MFINQEKLLDSKIHKLSEFSGSEDGKQETELLISIEKNWQWARFLGCRNNVKNFCDPD